MTDMILASYILNYPLLAAWGYTLDKPLLLISKNVRKTNTFLQKLVAYHSSIFKDLSSVTNTQPIMIIPITGGQRVEYLSTLISNFETSALSGEYVPCLIAVSQLAVDCDVSNMFFECFFDAPEDNFNYVSLVPNPENLPVVAHQIKELSFQENFNAFIAACCFLKDWAIKTQSDNYFNELLKLSQSLFEECVTLSGSSIALVFNDRLDQYLASNPFDLLRKLPFVGHDDLLTKIFCSKRYVYIANTLFREIVAPLNKLFSDPQIKRSLVDFGLLQTEEKTTFLSKMLYLENEKSSSAKMLKLEITKLGSTAIQLIKNETEAL